MKNITPVIGKHNLVVDGVLASLVSRLEATDERYAVSTNIHCRVQRNLSAVRPDL